MSLRAASRSSDQVARQQPRPQLWCLIENCVLKAVNGVPWRSPQAGRVQLRSLAPMFRRRRGILTASRQWLLAATGATAHSSVLLRMSSARASSETGNALKFNSSVPIPAKSRFPKSRLFPRPNRGGKGRRDSEMPGSGADPPAGPAASGPGTSESVK
jgi:hypothetical protein